MQKLQRHGMGQGVWAPENLILGLKAGAAVPTDWTVFSDADNKFLKGTDSDAVVETTGARSSFSVSTGSGGSHSGGSAANHRYANYYSSCSGDCGHVNPSGSSVGSHSGHSIAITYRPPAAKLKLIQATVKTKIPASAIMFGLAANSDQTLYDLLNDEADTPLMAASTTEIAAQIKSAGNSSSRSYSHSHWYSANNQKLHILSCYESYSSGGPSHNHSGGTPSITHALERATVRAFEIIDQEKITGLIGMWIGAGVPDGWEIVAALVGKYLVFSTTGDGSSSGNNTISVSGSTGGSSHSHGFGGSANASCSPLHHSNSLSHSHSYSRTAAYEPERYFIKFIRYTG